jgi:hypothetical protein
MKMNKLIQQLAELDENIQQGLEFEKQGYDCGMMLALTCVLRDKVLAELEAENESCSDL